MVQAKNVLSNPEIFKAIMSDLKKLSEKSDEISAYDSCSYKFLKFLLSNI